MKDFLKKWILPPGILQLANNIYANKQKKPRKLTAEDKKLLEKNEMLADRHTGERCFILGTGSSIKKQDLSKLAGEIVISVSNAFVHPEYNIFQPRYHVLPPLLKSHSPIHSENQWPKWLKEMEEKTYNAEMFLHVGDRNLIEKNKLFLNRTIHWVEYTKWNEKPINYVDLSTIPGIWSVSELAITIALYMNFEKIYLLGFDHDWFKGPVAHFYDATKEHVMKPTPEKLSFADAEFQMRRHAYIFKKYKNLYSLKKNIFNANADPNHYMDVFPKVNFDKLFDGN
jgi:hypothetical protein